MITTLHTLLFLLLLTPYFISFLTYAFDGLIWLYKFLKPHLLSDEVASFIEDQAADIKFMWDVVFDAFCVRLDKVIYFFVSRILRINAKFDMLMAKLAALKVRYTTKSKPKSNRTSYRRNRK